MLEPPSDPLAWEPAEFASGVLRPCCAEEWDIGVSPPLPAPDQPLADGVYTFTFEYWINDPDFTAPALVAVRRLESCDPAARRGSDLGFGCLEDWGDGAVDEDVRYAIQFPLAIDERVVVGYAGTSACEPEITFEPYVTTGAGFAEMSRELATDYNTWIAPFLTGPGRGDPLEEVLGRLTADPTSPFEPQQCGVTWTSSRGIPVLLQAITAPGGGMLEAWELLMPNTMHVRDGVVMLYVTGSYRP